MFAITPTPWKQRHGNSDREQLLLYMCASSPINYMYMYAPWHVLAWISVLLISHRCLGTVQYLCFCKLYSLICTMVAVAFDHIFFSQEFFFGNTALRIKIKTTDTGQKVKQMKPILFRILF